MTELEQLKAQIAALEATNAALRKANQGKLTLKISAKGAVSLYGMGRFPVTLYAEQWDRVFDAMPQIRAFMEANAAQLSTKDDKPQSLAEHQEGRSADGLAN